MERITIVGPKGEMKNVSILGPVRKADQVELSLTDLRKIGIAAPVRESGDIEGTPGCKLIGPAGEVDIERVLSLQSVTFTSHPKMQKNLALRTSRLSALKLVERAESLSSEMLL